MTTLFENRQPSPPVTLKFTISRRSYAYLCSLKSDDIKRLRPAEACDKNNAKRDQCETYTALRRFLQQPKDHEGEQVLVHEHYGPPRSGFPGRLYSPNGSQSLWSPLRSLMQEDMAELDQSRSVHRITKYVAETFGVGVPLVMENYLDRPDDCIRDVMRSQGCSKAEAKRLFNLTWTREDPLKGIRDDFLKLYDTHAKRVRAALMQVKDLKWVADASKGAGSFMSNLTQFVEAKLSASVLQALHSKGVDVYSWTFDGLYVDRKWNEGQEILDLAHTACEAIAPGINMIWAWKLPDPTVYDKAGNAVSALNVPMDFVPPPSREDEWDPETQPLYEDYVDPEGKSYEGLRTVFARTHCKVGSTYIDSGKEPGKYHLLDKTNFIKENEHMIVFKAPELATDAEGNQYLKTGPKYKESFIQLWISDHRMDPRYLKDKTMRYYWKYFDCFPIEDECPDECFNTWKGFAAEDLDPIDWEDDEGSVTAREHLRVILQHIEMLCSSNKEQYAFLLDLLAHALQYPQKKIGIMICLVGEQGAGKTHLWNLLRKLIGERACFETDDPKRDVWGDNNASMIDAFFVRITEADRAEFKGCIGKMRTKISDVILRVRSLYCAPTNVKSFARYFLDTNEMDAIPDEHGERRFFIVKCSTAKKGDLAYFKRLVEAIDSVEGVRAFYDYLQRRRIKSFYVGDDIPVGEYQRTLKDHNRKYNDRFVQAIVESRPVTQAVLRWSAECVYDFYQQWESNGTERKKESVMKMLDLVSFDGITKHTLIDPGTQMATRTYEFNLATLRKRYGLDQLAVKEAARAKGSKSLLDPLPPETIDVDADVQTTFPPCKWPAKRPRHE